MGCSSFASPPCVAVGVVDGVSDKRCERFVKKNTVCVDNQYMRVRDDVNNITLVHFTLVHFKHLFKRPRPSRERRGRSGLLSACWMRLVDTKFRKENGNGHSYHSGDCKTAAQHSLRCVLLQRRLRITTGSSRIWN
jgi:hypothetical protein